MAETGIHTGELCAEDFHKLILDHSTTYNVAVTDKISNESIFRLIVDFFGRTDLLDIALIHDNDRI